MFDLRIKISLTENVFRDKFSQRLMIPVFDKNGQVVGFTGRILPNDPRPQRPKYLNSAESKWFKKGQLWFGWNLAKDSILKQKKAIIVEGNMDVIAAFGHGLDFTLAAQGTSFTQEQIRQLKNLTSTVWLAFDNDSAGWIASCKFFKSATKSSLVVHKVLIPEQFKDLDEYLQKNGSQNLQVQPFLDFILAKKQLELTSNDSQIQRNAILEILDLLSACDELSASQYLKKINSLTQISQKILQNLLDKHTKNSQLQDNFAQIQQKIPPKTLEQDVLVTFQKLLRLELEQKLDAKLRIKLNSCFELLRLFLLPLKEFENLESYLSQKKEELLLEQIDWNISENSQINNYWPSIMRFLDSRFEFLIFDINLSQKYLEIKNDFEQQF